MTRVQRGAIIINVFALLHAVVAVLCRATGILDDLILTLLTMLLVVLLCLRHGMDVKFMAIAIILANVLGFFIGTGCASIVGLFSSSPLVIYPMSTFITTEFIGWCTLGCILLVRRKLPDGAFAESTNIHWLISAMAVIICMRLAFMLLRSSSTLTHESTVLNVLVNYVVSCAVLLGMAEYVIRLTIKASEEKAKAHQAQYRYMKLKQQVDPHFLFNSLNILDCMVCEEQTAQASTYIHKLAGIYRYMLSNEDETLVKLRDEMGFVEQYTELLKVRFQDGFTVNVDIPSEYMQKQVVPCSVQLLIENAIKHNAVGKDSPLEIKVTAGEDGVTVTNNLNPKQTSGTSTGLGLKYIRQQYQDLAGREVTVAPDEHMYRITLPLI